MRGFSLARRVTLIVAIPLICQLILVVVLFPQLKEMQSYLYGYSQSRDMIGEIYKFTDKLIQAVGALKMGADQSGMISQDTGAADIEKALKQFRSLADFARSDSSRRANLDALIPAFDDIYQFYLWIRREHQKGEGHWKTVNDDFPQKMVAKANRLHAAIDAFVSDEQKKFPYQSGQEKWNSIKALPYIAIAGSVVLAIVLGFTYALTIKKPIARISENCRRMSEDSEKLLPPLSSNDELGDLDHLIHRLSSSLSEALDKEKAMIDNARDMICSLNAQGIFVRTNAYCCELLGLSEEELIGKSLLDICSADDQIRADEELRTVSSTAEMGSFDLKLNRAGETVDTRWSCIWSDRDFELFAVVHDITEEKNVERLKQDFVDMISHDLRSPLTSMLGSLTMLQAGARGPLPEAADLEVDSAIKSVERLIEFVNDLLDFQKLKAARMELDKEEFSLKEVVDEAVDLVRANAEAKQLVLSLPESSKTVFGDQQKLLQVAMNLLANAIRFAPVGSDIKVEFVESADCLEVRIIDKGPGVPTEFQEKIFDAFEQVPSSTRSKEGTGLGLAICKLIVEAHGGTIGVRGISSEDVQPETGRKDRKLKTGSIFWFTVPRKNETEAKEKSRDGEDSTS